MNPASDSEKEECRRLLDGLSLYLDGEAEAALCAEIEAHMAECENCRIVVDTLRKTVLLYREESPAPLPSDVRRRLYAALKLEDYLVTGKGE
ncbi:MAG: zf-HC2 domain-containing protein [Anaerolineae bacterium]|nr:zf-HC2 domain-containing protein [Anaerolineae bacterium]